jgi:hypothetical protein
LRFDDRLATVLDQPAGDAHGRAVQWRQLVELLARGSGETSAEIRDQALHRVARLMEEVPPAVLAATARAIAGPGVPAELVALFAAALLASAELGPSGWAAVRAVAAPDVLPLLEALAPAPVPAAAPAAADRAPAPAPSSSPAQSRPSLPEAAEATHPAPPPAGLFRWECGPTGEIDWVEGAPRAALIGRSLTDAFADRFAARLPFSDLPLALAEEGALAGEWRWSGTPAFFPDTGRFAGYRGIARREGAETPSAAASSVLRHPGDDDLRELMHELRTPLNAIIGFGEIIEGQYLGPAHRAYRDRAATIVREARRLADAVDSLDLAAKLRSGRMAGEKSCGTEEVRAALAGLAAEAADRSVVLWMEDRAGSGQISLPAPLTERLVRQLGGFVLDRAGQGERLGAVLDRIGGQLALALDRPRQLAGFSEAQLLGGVDVPGARFPLRLLQGLAAMTGARLDIAVDRLVLLFPLEG